MFINLDFFKMLYILCHSPASKTDLSYQRKAIHNRMCVICFSITGLTAIVTTNCTDKEPFLQRKLTWTDYVNPCALLILYFYFAFETNRKLSQKVKFCTKKKKVQ